ncbi:MAG TPA: hypothetical protein VGJ75_03910 [Dongiaceae bacterium]
MGEPEQHPDKGMIDHAIGIVKGLTFTNVGVIALLFLMAAPAYLAWRVLNDDKLLTVIFSQYQELPLKLSECGVRVAAPRGQKPTWFITASFVLSGEDRWYIGVNTPIEPTEARAEEYCNTLTSLIDYARDPTNPIPTFPGTTKPFPFIYYRPQEKQP